MRVTNPHAQDPWNRQPPPPPPPPDQPGYGPPAAHYGSPTPPYPPEPVPPAPPVQGSWWHRLPLLAKTALIGGATLVLCCGGLTIAAIARPASNPDAAPTGPPSSVSATTGAPLTPLPDPSPTAQAKPTVETRTVTETRPIPFATRTVNDPTLAKGTTKVRNQGVAGVKTLTYQVTFTNGVETSRKLVREVVTKAPVTQVVVVGTKQTQQCDPNYADACVPIASDVDCAGGSGDLPAYVQGPVRVIGTDIYGLDHDHDGIGCEN